MVSGWLQGKGKVIVKGGGQNIVQATCYLGIALTAVENMGEEMGS